jgi:hypothetical protein
MKISEFSGGVATTLRIRTTSGPFQPIPKRDDEVGLVRSADVTLLTVGRSVWTIEGVTPSDTTTMVDVVGSGLPMLAYVAQAGADILVIETRRLTQERRVVEPMQLGLDDKTLEDVRRVHRVGGTPADVAAWLEDRLLAPPAPHGPVELRRLVISGDPCGRLDAFRIYGYKVAADVRLIDNKYRIDRVVRGGNGANHRLILLYAPASIVDATIAATMHGAVRTALSEAVTGENSYLRTWQTYQKLEMENVLRRARTFGALQYRTCERQRDGGWRFQLAPLDDLAARLSLLGEETRFELEAGEVPPELDEPTFAAVGPSSVSNVPRLSAAIAHVDYTKPFVDLAAPDEDDVQPKPPKSGYLYLSLRGDEVRLRRRARAEEALRTGNCPLPQLGLLMEGRPALAARRAKVSVHGPRLWPVIRDVFGSVGPTLRQLDAIEFALTTPDVCLIQGPPGTGKTKVITAIEQCLAVLADEGVEPSHRILVSAAQHDAVENVAQRTEVFGLPAVKVGRRRNGSDTAVDPAQVFADERREVLRARVRRPPEAERLSQARALAVACYRMKSLPAEQEGRLRDLVRVLDDLLAPDLRDKVLERASSLSRPTGAADLEEADLMLKAARAIRVNVGPFSDDGPIQARKALRRLAAVLTVEERRFLERCAEVEPGGTPSWLAEGQALRDGLVDRLTPSPAVAEPRLDEETQQLLLEVFDSVDRRLAASRNGDEATLAAYLNDLETDPDGVASALAHYTVVLASTLQAAAGKDMRGVCGIDEGQTTFESVIVDEAARAHPLDLFIPLSMARRRVVLVGDHRQLPHMLEPDVERQLAERVDQGTVEAQTLQAVQASLFERLWVLLRALEDKDENQRTVRLNAQYRMHPELGQFVSRTFYEYRDDEVIESPRPAGEFAHDLPGYSRNGKPCAAAWVDVPGDRGRDVRGKSGSVSRRVEARAIAKEVRRLIEHDSTLSFGVIAFYADQVAEIGRAMIDTGLTESTNDTRGWRVAEGYATTYNAKGKTIERLRIGTVDAFQGREFDVVFLSVTRSNDLPGQTDEQQRRKYGHLMLENRLCVAMSRQQRLLVAVGDLAFVRKDEAAKPLRALRAYAELCGGDDGVVR